MIGNRRLGIGSGAEASSFSFTHPTTTGNTYQFRIATSTGYLIMVDSAGRKIPTTMPSAYGTYTNMLPVPIPPAVAAYTSYTTNGNGATSCTVFSTDINGNKSGTITHLDFPGIGTLLTETALDISKCAKSLTFLSIVGQTNISSVTGLSSCKSLTELQVNRCGFTSLDCTPLTELVTVLANDQSSLTAFTAGPKLKSLTIFNCPQLPTAAFALEPANSTLEFLDCSNCPSLSDLGFAQDIAYAGRSIRLSALKVLNVSNTGQQSLDGYFWPSYSMNKLTSFTAQNLSYISSLSYSVGSNAGVWPALTSLNLSNSDLKNDPWRIPTTVTALNLQGIRFAGASNARIGFDLTGCTLLTDFAAVFGDMSSAVVKTPSYTSSMTTTAARELILDGSGFTSINIQQTDVLAIANYPLLKLSAQGMPNLTSFTLTNPAWLKTIQITNNPILNSITITGASNRTVADIGVTISGNTLLTTRTFSDTWINKTPVPTITSVSPNYGPLAGGTAITITGTNLTGAYSVTVDGVALTSVNVASATSITAVTPAGTAGQKSVLVKTVATSAVTTAPASNFAYITAPVITTISPASGSTNIGGGNTKVTFTGSSFLSTTSIKLNNLATHAFTGIVITSDTSMYAYSPARGTLTAFTSYPVYITNSIGTTQKLGFAYYS